MRTVNKISFSFFLLIISLSANAQVNTGDTTGMEYHNVSFLLSPDYFNGSYSFSSEGLYIDVTKDTIWDILPEAYQRQTISSLSGRNSIILINHDFELVFNPMTHSARMFHELTALHSSMYWYRCTSTNSERINLAEFTDSINFTSSGMWYNTNGLGDGFIGFRVASHSDTLYGWLHLVSTISLSSQPLATLYIKDWAIQKIPSVLNETDESILIQTFPNPFSDQFNIFVESNQLFQINIYDVSAKKILQQEFMKFKSINTSQFSKGVYLYEIKGANDFRKTGKIIKE